MNDILVAVLRSGMAFLVLLVIARIEGNTQLSQLTYFNYVTGITIGSIAATLSIDSSVSEAEGLAGLVSWGALSFLVGWLSLKNLTF
ncbi:MAG: DUF421 domain-containing protein, partial [Bacillota bacterium]|nr:DUF421 domain-containing protein [Bacillota bacterium]